MSNMTNQEVVAGAERVARALLVQQGFSVPGQRAIRHCPNPPAQEAWRTVCLMLKAWDGTDLQAAVDSVERAFGADTCTSQATSG